MLKFIFSSAIFIGCLVLNAQDFVLSNNAEVSVITVGPGDGLVDAFGHSGIRIKDEANYLDVIFDYGRYDFDSYFILKFARGKLNYKLSVSKFSDFLQYYKFTDRTVKSQVLNFNEVQKQRLYDFLIENLKPENRYYLYDFFYDNCATIIRDVTQHSTLNDVVFNIPKAFKKQTFRQLIHSDLNQNTWGSLGIDIALGSVIDRTAIAEEHMFLPKYINSFFETATFGISKKNLVKSSSVIYKARTAKQSSMFVLSPLVIFTLLAALIIFITYKNVKSKVRSRWLDSILFALTGLIGIGILLLWFATDHTATAYNYNLLWAFALNILMLKQVRLKQPKLWFIKYIKFLIIALCLLALHWIIGVQWFAISLLPFLIALIVRYVYLVNYFKTKIN